MDDISAELLVERLDKWRGYAIAWAVRRYGSRLCLQDFEEAWNDVLFDVWKASSIIKPNGDERYAGIGPFVMYVFKYRIIMILRKINTRTRKLVSWDDKWWDIYVVRPDVVTLPCVDLDRFVIEVMPLLPPVARRTFLALWESMSNGEFARRRLGEKLGCSEVQARGRLRELRVTLERRGFGVGVRIPVQVRCGGGRRVKVPVAALGAVSAA